MMRFKPQIKQRCKHYYKRPSMEMATEWDMQLSCYDDCNEKDYALVETGRIEAR